MSLLKLNSGFFKTISSFMRSFNTSAATPHDRLPIIHINATFNNTIATVTDHKGLTKAWTSTGVEGYRNAKKGTKFAAQSVGVAAAKKAKDLGFERVRIKLKGIGPGRQSAVKGIEMGGVSIASIQDVTPIPHNGCRPRKVRRL